MEKDQRSLLIIKENDLAAYKEEVTNYLKQVSWAADNQQSKSDIDLSFLIHHGKSLGVHEEDSLSILKNAVRISDDRTILSNTTNQVLNLVRKGFCLGRHVSELYATASGLELLQQKNKDGNIYQAELPEFHDKSQTQTAVLLFVASSYIVQYIADIKADEVSSIQVDFSGIPELNLSRPSKGLQCSLYYYAAYLERSGIVTSDLHFLKITSIYFERVLEEIALRKEAFKFTEAFTNHHYKLEKSEFLIDGFERSSNARVKGYSFNPTRMEAIVANRDAKHYFKRYSERLLCYDFEAKKNPMNELGGLPSITMADGKPGTGKSMLIAATATLLQERCDQLGYNFLFWPLPENIVSTYQGGTAERAIEWFKPMQDPSKIVFAPIDDAENNLEERTRQGVSAGVREFIGVFLRNTEGAYAVNYGNRLMSLFTNIPDQIDKAVLSRIQMRTKMDGATTHLDFVDQDHLWWKKYNKLDDSFIDATDPKGYVYMDSQKGLASISDLASSAYSFDNKELEEIFNQVAKNNDPTSHSFFGALYSAVQQRYNFFSSRDLRNIQKAVDARIIDFDLPELWWENPDEFFAKNYDDKLVILKDLMKENLKDSTFTSLRTYEALNYMDTAIRINQTGIQREIKETAKRMYIQEEARKQMIEGRLND